MGAAAVGALPRHCLLYITASTAGTSYFPFRLCQWVEGTPALFDPFSLCIHVQVLVAFSCTTFDGWRPLHWLTGAYFTCAHPFSPLACIECVDEKMSLGWKILFHPPQRPPRFGALVYTALHFRHNRLLACVLVLLWCCRHFLPPYHLSSIYTARRQFL